MDKNKLILPISILLGCIILGGVYFIVQMNKQESIEKQQQIELRVKQEADDANKEKESEEKIFANNLKCQNLLKDLKEKWNNVVGIYYDDLRNTCMVKYTEKDGVEEAPLETMQDN